MEKVYFERPVQATRALQDVTGINRTVFTQAANNGLLGESAYRSGDSWLFDTSHPDFDAWYQSHWDQPRVKGKKSILP